MSMIVRITKPNICGVKFPFDENMCVVVDDGSTKRCGSVIVSVIIVPYITNNTCTSVTSPHSRSERTLGQVGRRLVALLHGSIKLLLGTWSERCVVTFYRVPAVEVMVRVEVRVRAKVRVRRVTVGYVNINPWD